MNPSNGSGRSRRPKNTIKTKSGNSLKINQSLGDRTKARKAARSAAKAEYLATLPKNRWKRIAYRMHPQRVAAYWFSREGGIMALKIIGAAIVVGFFLTIGLFAYFRKDLPQIKDISGDNIGGSVTYYDSTDKTVLWQDYNAVKRVGVQGNQISPYMKEATVAIEDKNFYKEGAFDVRGILRAATQDAFGSGGIQGGSTITQQLVKLNENWTNNRTLTRKVKELILAVELEREYTKNDILTGYLNIAPYGGIDYGVEAAAEDYFQTDAKDLTLPEAAMLAAIPQAPGYYSPYSSTQFNPESGNTFSESAMLDRQHYILDQMVKQGYITQAQDDAAKQVDVLSLVHPMQGKYQNMQAPYFVLAAKQQLLNKYGSPVVDRGGWKVTTTLNLGLQANAEKDVAANAKNVARYKGDEEAMVAEDVKTGQVVAQVGGENFNDPVDGQIDYADTNVSPGSSFKPFVYAALIQNNTNVGSGSVLYDSQGPVPGYACTDKTQPTATSNGGNCLWDDNYVYPGPETLRYALAGSRNVPAVKASLEVLPNDTSPGYTKSVNKWLGMANAAIGVNNAYACYQQNVNIETAGSGQQTQCYGSAAIGSGDVKLDQEVNGDATFARMGQEIPQTYILNITDSTGKSIYKWTQPKATQVYKPDTAYIVNSMLDDPRASYLTTAQKFQNWNGWNIAVKTGTENDSYNGVMTAWSTQYAVIGFVGYHTLNQKMTAGHFEDLTEPITRSWMEQALTALNTKPINWTAPSDLKTMPGYIQRVTTGFGAQVPGPTNELFPSWYTGNKSSGTETIDKVSGLAATSCTPAAAKQTAGGANDGSFSVDIFFPKTFANMDAMLGKSTSTSGSLQSDNVHNCSDSPPTITLTAPSTCTNSCTVTAVATQGTHALTDPNYPNYPGTITFTLNGNTINTSTCSSSQSNVCQATFTYSPSSSGSGNLTATVTDSVLYSSSTSSPLTYSGANPISIGSISPANNLTPTVSWSGGGGTYTVVITGGSGGSGCTTTNTSCPVTFFGSGNYTVTVNDSNGDTPGTTTYHAGP